MKPVRPASRPPPALLKGVTLPATRGSKRRRIMVALRHHLINERPALGSRIPSTHALMQRFKVSYVTMHSALDDLVREGWLLRHQGKGTFVARTSVDRADRNRPTHSRLALVLPPQEDMRRSWNADTVLSLLYGCNRGVEEYSGELATISLSSSELSAREIRQVLDQLLHYDGVLFIGLQFEALIAAVRPRLPLVIMGARCAEDSFVNYDQREGIRLAVQHLTEHGYRRIGYLGVLKGESGVKHTLFREFLQQQRITWNRRWCWDCPEILDAHLAARRFLSQSPRPDAVFVDNYFKAKILVRLAEQQKLRVPDDFAVLTYGTEPASATSSRLSMVEVPHAEIGKAATQLLDRLVRGDAVSPSSRIIQPQLRLHYSCGCPAHREDSFHTQHEPRLAVA
jgi:DNA-binding LacI/PurR family transcriptional regulator